MSAVVTMVVSKAEMNRQNHRPAMIVCNLAGLMLGTLERTPTGLSTGFEAMLSRSHRRFTGPKKVLRSFVVAVSNDNR